MAKLAGNAIVAQAGGPTVVINQTLVGIVEAAEDRPEIEVVLGARHGMEGILGESFLDLGRQSRQTLEAVAATPGAALGSTRKRPTEAQCLQMFEVMRRHGVHYFFYIGGNDTAEAVKIVNDVARGAGYPLRCFHVPKTIDNDLLVTDHCPGYGSAGRFVALAFAGDNLDNRSLPGIKVNVVMGRHAGFLTAAAALARQREEDGPHLIYVPERPVTRERIRDEVAAVHERLGWCVVAVCEGVEDEAAGEGVTFLETIRQDLEVSEYRSKQLSGSGTLGDWLVGYLKEQMGTGMRMRADTLGYLQRSFPGVVSETDAQEARECGRRAVQFATTGDLDGSVVMRCNREGGRYTVSYEHAPLEAVAAGTKEMPGEFLAPSGSDITPAFLDYVRPLVGPLPVMAYLEDLR